MPPLRLFFVTLQDVFHAMGPLGSLFGVIFYLLVFVAAVSSSFRCRPAR